jgi:hypothetical protein
MDGYQTPGMPQVQKPTLKIKLNRPANPSPLQHSSSPMPSDPFTPSSNPGSEDIDFTALYSSGSQNNGMDMDTGDTEDDDASDSGSGFHSLDEPMPMARASMSGKTVPGQQRRESWADLANFDASPLLPVENRFSGKSLPGRS